MATYTIGKCVHRLWGAHETSEAAVFDVHDSGGNKVLQYLIPIECFTQMTNEQVDVALMRAMRDFEAGNPVPVFKSAISTRCTNLVSRELSVNL